MLDRMTWVNDIKTSLGYPVVNLAMTDDMIEVCINKAINTIVPYLNNVEVFEVPTKTTTFTDKKIYAVIRVTASDNYADIERDSAIYRGFYTINNKRLVDSALYSYYIDTVQDDLGQIGFRFISNTLYVDGDHPPYCVEAITEKSIANMTEDYVNWCFEYSLALVKITEGEIRSKVKITGSPVETNGSDLKAEGIAERDKLKEALGVTIGLFYATR